MTVFESLSSWLYDILADPENGLPGAWKIDSETLPDYSKQDWQSTAIYSNPTDTQTRLIAGQIKHTDYKTFYLRRGFGDVKIQIKNEAVLEKIKECIYEKNRKAVYPKDGRDWYGISWHGGAYPTTKGDDRADYQINLKLVYED
jgi:hypothetical protein